MSGKTIKILADEMGVSKTAIRKWMSPDFREKYTETLENGVIMVSEEGANILKTKCTRYRKSVETPKTTENQLPETLETESIAWYQEQLSKAWEQNQVLQQQLIELSGKVGTSIESLSQGQLAEKLIEGKKLQIEMNPEDIRNQSFFKKLKWLITKE